jgi:hypothetical protein
MAPTTKLIRYLQSASTDGGAYYDAICKVLDWEWDYYVQNHDFINVIDEYAKVKAGENIGPGDRDNILPADNMGIAAAETATQADTPTLAAMSAERPAIAAAANNSTPIQDGGAKPAGKGLIEKAGDNIAAIIIGAALLLLFGGLRVLNKKRKFQSEEAPSRLPRRN